MQNLRLLLIPLSFIYHLIISLKKLLYKANYFKQFESPVPVICVGNIRIGGTGKTQIIITLAEKLTKQGFKIAILSRGYKRKSKGFMEVDTFDNQKFGDEPVMIKQVFPDVRVFVSENRVVGIKKILSLFRPDFILMDDGLQNLTIKKDYSICLIDKSYFSKKLMERLLLPAGNLREPRSGIQKYNCVIFNTKFHEASKDLLIERPFHNNLFVSEYKLTGFFDSNGVEIKLQELKSSRNLIFCGIAQPESFLKLFRQLQIPFEISLFFDDHHDYNLKDLKRLLKFARNFNCNYLITTNKDFVRIQKFIDEFQRAGVSPLYAKIDAVIQNVELLISDIICLKNK